MQQDTASFGRFRAGLVEGMRRTLPVTLYVAPMGFAFGAAATQGGMSVEATLLISAVMCSGSAQFAALAVYSSLGVAVIPMLLAAFTLNARHILLGAAISPWMNKVSFSRQVAAVIVLSEPTWALVIRMHDVEGVRNPARLAGALASGGIAMWACWIAGTAFGAILGSDFGDLSRFGLDLLVIAFFASLAAAFWRSPRQDLLPWIAAGAAAILAERVLPPGWHILAGGIVGGLVGLLLPYITGAGDEETPT